MKYDYADLLDGLQLIQGAFFKDFDFIGPKDLNITQERILIKVGEPVKVPMSDIAIAIGIEKGPFSQTVDKMVKKDYVVRKRSEKDRRIVYLELTEKGEKYSKAMRKEVNEHMDNVLNGIDDSEKLIEALKTIKDTAELLLRKDGIYNDRR
ncbi:MarR family transcriptional regulator [Vallitalea sediminicola]